MRPARGGRCLLRPSQRALMCSGTRLAVLTLLSATIVAGCGVLIILARGSSLAQPDADLLGGGGPACLPQSDSSCRAGGDVVLALYSRPVAPAAAAGSCSASSRFYSAVVDSLAGGRYGGAGVTGSLRHWRQPGPSWAAGVRAPPPSRQLAAGIDMPPPRLCAAASTPRSAFRVRVQQAVLSSAP